MSSEQLTVPPYLPDRQARQIEDFVFASDVTL
jgi:hypothetical protein